MAFAWFLGDETLALKCADQEVDSKKVSELSKLELKNGDKLISDQARATLEKLLADDRDLGKNLRDLQGHADDFENRTGFTYSVLDPATGEVIGCVYIYPDKSELHDANVRSWVRASRAELDAPLWRAVTDWLEAEWPFRRVAYSERR